MLSTTSNRTSPGSGSKNYVASIQSLLDVPPGPDVMSRATEEMGIEAMLRWPVCKESLDQLGISTSATLVEMLGQVSTHIAPATLGHDSQSFKRQTVLHLVENFLIHNNVKNPIIDPVELRRDAEELLDSSYRHGGRFCRLVSKTPIRMETNPDGLLLQAPCPCYQQYLHISHRPCASRPSYGSTRRARVSICGSLLSRGSASHGRSVL
jgi:hypothetical protein